MAYYPGFHPLHPFLLVFMFFGIFVEGQVDGEMNFVAGQEDEGMDCPQQPPITENDSSCTVCTLRLNEQYCHATIHTTKAMSILGTACKGTEVGEGASTKCNKDALAAILKMGTAHGVFKIGYICQYACDGSTGGQLAAFSASHPNETAPNRAENNDVIGNMSLMENSISGQSQSCAADYATCLAKLHEAKINAKVELQYSRDNMRVGCESIDVMVQRLCRQWEKEASDGMNNALDTEFIPEDICKEVTKCSKNQ